MSSYLRQRPESDHRITIDYGAQLRALKGNKHLTAVCVANADGDKWLDAAALFIMIGAVPNTGWLSDLVEIDEKNFVKDRRRSQAESAY
jgi:thioredoxin reductase (NADPH)